jgi:hypothetical protein
MPFPFYINTLTPTQQVMSDRVIERVTRQYPWLGT